MEYSDMTKTPILFAAALFVSTAAFAGSDNFTKVDSDGDGRVTFEELVAAMPGVTADKFKAADTNGDDALSSEEYAAAMQ